MGTSNIPVHEANKNALKQKTLQYMPRNLGDVEAQRQILLMIAEAVPQVMSCVNQADVQIWPKVTGKEQPIGNAIAQCAYQTDKIIGAAFPESLALKNLPEQVLLRAWIALDYYAYVLKAEYSINIQNLQNRITDILLGEKKTGEWDDGGATQLMQDAEEYDNTVLVRDAEEYDNTVLVRDAEEYGDTVLVRNVEEYGTTQPVQNVEAYDTTQSARELGEKAEIKKSKQKRTAARPQNPKKLIWVCIVLLAAALLALFAFDKTRLAESAIKKIGTVTLASEKTIEAAEQRVAELTDQQRSKVDNYSVLLEARAEYNRLETQDAIDRIGKVTMESGEAIDCAEQLYGELSRDKRNQVENYQTLTAARKEYTRLTTAVQEASEAIDAIGTVTLESGSKIEAARSAYDALKKDNLQSYVSDKAGILTNAETTYAQCVSEDLYNTGMGFFGQGSYDEALANFNAIISDYPQTTMLDSAKDAAADCQIELARQAYQRNEQYTAITMLNALEQKYQSSGEWQELRDSIFNKLKNARPSTGTTLAGDIGWGQCYFEVKAAETDICFKVQDVEDASKFKTVYVRAGQSTKIYVADGVYAVRWATGEYWYEKDHLFGDETEYQKMRGSTTFTTSYEGNWVYYWYLELDLNDADLGAMDILADQF